MSSGRPVTKVPSRQGREGTCLAAWIEARALSFTPQIRESPASVRASTIMVLESAPETFGKFLGPGELRLVLSLVPPQNRFVPPSWGVRERTTVAVIHSSESQEAT